MGCSCRYNNYRSKFMNFVKKDSSIRRKFSCKTHPVNKQNFLKKEMNETVK